ncbi:hypothetical protein BU24DRAFT_413324 [Aaosphaeria arxii CBS 175.79]|uniref:Transcription factor Nrm1/Whi5 n=1 Tax=Aaosphaeria arxii CBS 175.79 TaxID=1450172 RepID=A0A6A5XFT5_9PLEO|nr:uncharacterized protein BU24DRAFT_413324 [Aaosphaeria arxii CBS 175.79]KAF2011697.1 hypothetical protein BU24DRAFT_413324 [Aaosphaeria arxii CBS 175.79]
MDQPAEVANKVLRRAQVSKMTRTLQNRLALANVKIKHGWESLSLDALEPRVDVELKRKRPGSSNETMSDASSVSERFYPTGVLDSSPLAAPIFSDELQRSGSRAGSRSGSSHGHNKRTRYNPSFNNYPGTSNHNRTKVRTSHTASASWKSMHRLPESSPVYARRHARFGTIHAPSLSFVSETSTVPDGSRSPILSEDDDEDLPITSFQLGNGSHLRSSPPRAPRTPPPAVARSARLRQSGFTAAAAAREGNPGQDEANLLMYLATSPSPARPGDSKPVMLAPSTPPPKQTPLPSSMMTTPRGGDATFPFGLSTPSTNLNFADFLNMTPSPAQATGSWGRTPAGGKTPAAAREARRRLNFDNIVPPTNETARTLKVEGLGMDLGGELVS